MIVFPLKYLFILLNLLSLLHALGILFCLLHWTCKSTPFILLNIFQQKNIIKLCLYEITLLDFLTIFIILQKKKKVKAFILTFYVILPWTLVFSRQNFFYIFSVDFVFIFYFDVDPNPPILSPSATSSSVTKYFWNTPCPIASPFFIVTSSSLIL